MIRNSIVLMTVIDLAVILLTIAALWIIYRNREVLRQLKLYSGTLVTMTGLIFIVMFYVADISIMHILPMLVSVENATKAMLNLHLNYNWVVTSIGVSLIIISIVYFNRVLFPRIVKLEDELKERVSTDSLTKAYNRLKFDEVLESEISRANRYDKMLSLIAFDIENCNFKENAKITVSFGVAQFRRDDFEETLIKRADDALYRAKANGRNRVEVVAL